MILRAELVLDGRPGRPRELDRYDALNRARQDGQTHHEPAPSACRSQDRPTVLPETERSYSWSTTRPATSRGRTRRTGPTTTRSTTPSTQDRQPGQRGLYFTIETATAPAAATRPGPTTGLLCDGTYTYQYNKSGNRIQRTNNSDGWVTLYAYDYREPAYRHALQGQCGREDQAKSSTRTSVRVNWGPSIFFGWPPDGPVGGWGGTACT